MAWRELCNDTIDRAEEHFKIHKRPFSAEAGTQAWSCEALELRPSPFDADPIRGAGEGLADSIAASMNRQLLR